jgi:hypothetical protein
LRKEQYERDHALIADAFSGGTLVKGPKSLPESILVKESEWYKMDYPQQISNFMQSFECSLAGLVASICTTWTARSLATEQATGNLDAWRIEASRGTSRRG